MDSNLDLDTLREIERDLVRRHFSEFVRSAWRHIDPAPLVWGVHMDALCSVLQAIAERRLQRIIINVPPGYAKSMVVAVLFPAWRWLRKPSWSLLAASHSLQLSTRDAVKTRALMESEWYKAMVRGAWTMRDDDNQKTFYKNSAGGFRLALSVGSGTTGYRSECQIVDDALDAKAAYSALKREEAVLWKTITMSTRFNDMERAEEIIIGQRLHEEDLPGYLLKHEGRGKWAHLNLPGEFEPDARAVVKDIHGKLIWEDPRKEAGELLFPAKFSAKVMKDLKLALGPYGYAGQIQQRPTPADGGLLKREWFNTRWAAPGTTPPTGMQCVPLPKAFSEMTIVADCAFKKTDTSDKVAIGVWGRQGTSLFLLDLRWERMTFTETLQAFLDLKAKWPKANKVIIEDKANGTAIIDVLRSRIPGVVPVQPDGGKEARIAASTPKWAAGNVVLPLQAPWVADFIEEAVSFPRAPHDDAIDMAAYAISAMLQNSNLSWLEAINKGL